MVVEEWLALDCGFVNQFTVSTPRRLAAVIAATGRNEFGA